MNVYTVYGRVKTGLEQWGEVKFHALSLERAPSYEMANAFVEEAIATYREPCVECVIVELKDGRDSYGSRLVIRRVSNAKAWWE